MRINIDLWQIVTGGLLIIGWLAVQFVILPYIKLELQRRASRKHSPQPEELWVQDGTDLLYIDAVGPLGVEIIIFDPQRKGLQRWRDTWPEWQQRLRSRCVVFTGQRRSLGDG